MAPKSAMQPDAKEAMFLLHVILNTLEKPKVDWVKVADATGLKNASTASVRFGQIKRKLAEKAGIELEPTIRTPTSKKRKNLEECETPPGGMKKPKKGEEYPHTPISYGSPYESAVLDSNGPEPSSLFEEAIHHYTEETV